MGTDLININYLLAESHITTFRQNGAKSYYMFWVGASWLIAVSPGRRTHKNPTSASKLQKKQVHRLEICMVYTSYLKVNRKLKLEEKKVHEKNTHRHHTDDACGE